eukprot:CAMPEP_0206425232 /NCGR_PEP_ID=MMETSP0324_2-20121206/3676_1 /ASSEMBLY_ACC=CAM_ASM_000836 /TAXON_ID=2866 /ORGANISM="Crypthecodinium cohnii, Strain Seligo" /LENGTH=735 /DNA_ID=CAMNT_0053889989 /DNA_START=311 /DNA_END=2515 /DNA_ORIENTATION=+
MGLKRALLLSAPAAILLVRASPGAAPADSDSTPPPPPPPPPPPSSAEPLPPYSKHKTAHPEWCVAAPDLARAGWQLVVELCDVNAPHQHFFVPRPEERGWIRPIFDSALCLDAPGGGEVQLWTCAKSPADNILWNIGLEGEIRWLRHPDQCLEIPGLESGSRTMKVQPCTATNKGLAAFEVLQADDKDCQWGDWDEWTSCSCSNLRARRRTVAELPEEDGSDCKLNDSTEWQECQRAEFCEVAEGGETEEGKKEGEEEVPVDASDLSVACMLFGCIIFTLSLFYLVNHHDKEIKMHSWQVISKTLSIFTAVNIYQGIDGLLDSFMPKWEAFGAAVLPTVQLVIWFTFMHLFIRHKAYEKAEAWATRGTAKLIEERSVSLSAWSMLLAHVSGFAAISAGKKIVAAFAEETESLSILAIPTLALMLMFLFWVADNGRNEKEAVRALSITFNANAQQQAGSDQDQIEKDTLDLWEEYSEEAENDVAGLSLSFLLAEVFVALAVGKQHLGHHRRLEASEHEAQVDGWMVVLFAFLSLVFALLTVSLVWVGSHFGLVHFISEPGVASATQTAVRWFFIGQSVCSMESAWLLKKAGAWQMARFLSANGVDLEHGVTEEVLIALVISMMAIPMIFLLDYIEDLDSTGEVADRCVRSIILSVGILIGFTWENAFDGGMEVLVELSQESNAAYPLWVKMGLAILMFLLVVPAWRHYIQRNAFVLEEDRRISSKSRSTGALLEDD